MSAWIAIYQLHSKFVNQRQDVPEDARQIVYYSLAVGHHVAQGLRTVCVDGDGGFGDYVPVETLASQEGYILLLEPAR